MPLFEPVLVFLSFCFFQIVLLFLLAEKGLKKLPIALLVVEENVFPLIYQLIPK